MISVQASRKGKREKNKGQATNNESNDDKQLQNLLEYLGVCQYPGLIPIFRKLGVWHNGYDDDICFDRYSLGYLETIKTVRKNTSS
jgi:hypothetical protein